MKRHRLALVLLLAAALLLSSCQFQLPGSTAPLLKIGLVAPFEGRFRARGYEMLYAVKLAVREWNEAGGAGSYRIELVALDDGGDPATAVQQAREMAVDADVLGVVGHFDEATTLAAALEYAALDLALVAPGVGAEGVTAAGSVMRFGPPNRLVGGEAARYALETLGAKRLAVLRSQEANSTADPQKDLADAFVSAVHQLGGTLVLDTSLAAEGWLSQLANAAPDMILIACEVMEGAEAIHLARQAGVKAVFIGGPALGDRSLAQLGGQWAEGVLYLAAAPAGLDAAGAEAFVAGYQALAGYAPGPRAMLAYEATHFLLRAMARAAEESPARPTRAAVWQQLTHSPAYEGLLESNSLDDSGQAFDWPIAIYVIEADGYPGQRLR